MALEEFDAGGGSSQPPPQPDFGLTAGTPTETAPPPPSPPSDLGALPFVPEQAPEGLPADTPSPEFNQEEQDRIMQRQLEQTEQTDELEAQQMANPLANLPLAWQRQTQREADEDSQLQKAMQEQDLPTLGQIALEGVKAGFRGQRSPQATVEDLQNLNNFLYGSQGPTPVQQRTDRLQKDLNDDQQYNYLNKQVQDLGNQIAQTSNMGVPGQDNLGAGSEGVVRNIQIGNQLQSMGQDLQNQSDAIQNQIDQAQKGTLSQDQLQELQLEIKNFQDKYGQYQTLYGQYQQPSQDLINQYQNAVSQYQDYIQNSGYLDRMKEIDTLTKLGLDDPSKAPKVKGVFEKLDDWIASLYAPRQPIKGMPENLANPQRQGNFLFSNSTQDQTAWIKRLQDAQNYVNDELGWLQDRIGNPDWSAATINHFMNNMPDWMQGLRTPLLDTVPWLASAGYTAVGGIIGTLVNINHPGQVLGGLANMIIQPMDVATRIQNGQNVSGKDVFNAGLNVLMLGAMVHGGLHARGTPDVGAKADAASLAIERNEYARLAQGSAGIIDNAKSNLPDLKVASLRRINPLNAAANRILQYKLEDSRTAPLLAGRDANADVVSAVQNLQSKGQVQVTDPASVQYGWLVPDVMGGRPLGVEMGSDMVHRDLPMALEPEHFTDEYFEKGGMPIRGAYQYMLENRGAVRVADPTTFEAWNADLSSSRLIEQRLVADVLQAGRRDPGHYMTPIGRAERIRVDLGGLSKSYEFTMGDFIDHNMNLRETLRDALAKNYATGYSPELDFWTRADPNKADQVRRQYGVQQETAGISGEASPTGISGETGARKGTVVAGQDVSEGERTGLNEEAGTASHEPSEGTGRTEEAAGSVTGERRPAPSAQEAGIRAGSDTDFGRPAGNAGNVLERTLSWANRTWNQAGFVQRIIHEDNLEKYAQGPTADTFGVFRYDEPGVIRLNLNKLPELQRQMVNTLQEFTNTLDQIPEGTMERAQAEAVIERLRNASIQDLSNYVAAHEGMHAYLHELLGRPDSWRSTGHSMIANLPEEWFQNATLSGLGHQVDTLRVLGNRDLLDGNLTEGEVRVLEAAVQDLNEHLAEQGMAAHNGLIPYSTATPEVFRDNVYSFPRFQEGVQLFHDWFQSRLADLKALEPAARVPAPSAIDALGLTEPEDALRAPIPDERVSGSTVSTGPADRSGLEPDRAGNAPATDQTSIRLDVFRYLRETEHPPVEPEIVHISTALRTVNPDLEAKEVAAVAQSTNSPVRPWIEHRELSRQAVSQAVAEARTPEEAVRIAAESYGYPDEKAPVELLKQARTGTGAVQDGFLFNGSASRVLAGLRQGEILYPQHPFSRGQAYDTRLAATDPESLRPLEKSTPVSVTGVEGVDWQRLEDGSLYVLNPLHVHMGDAASHVRGWAEPFKRLIEGQAPMEEVPTTDFPLVKVDPDHLVNLMDVDASARAKLQSIETGRSIDDLRHDGLQSMREAGFMHPLEEDPGITDWHPPGPERWDAWQDHLERRAQTYMEVAENLRTMGGTHMLPENLSAYTSTTQIPRNPAQAIFTDQYRNTVDDARQAFRQGPPQSRRQAAQQAAAKVAAQAQAKIQAAMHAGGYTLALHGFSPLYKVGGNLKRMNQLQGFVEMLANGDQHLASTLDAHKIYGNTPEGWAKRYMDETQAIKTQTASISSSLRKLFNADQRQKITEALDVGNLGQRERERRIRAMGDPEMEAVTRLVHEHWQLIGRIAEARGVIANAMNDYLAHILKDEGPKLKGVGRIGAGRGFRIERQRDANGDLLYPDLKSLQAHTGRQAYTDIADILYLHDRAMIGRIRMAEEMDFLRSRDITHNGYRAPSMVERSQLLDPKIVPQSIRDQYREVTKGPYRYSTEGHLVYKPLADYMDRAAPLIDPNAKFFSPETIAKAVVGPTNIFKRVNFFGAFHAYTEASSMGVGLAANSHPLLGIPSSLTGFGNFLRGLNGARMGAKLRISDPWFMREAVEMGFTPPEGLNGLPDELGRSKLDEIPLIKQSQHFVFQTIGWNSAFNYLKVRYDSYMKRLARDGVDITNPDVRKQVMAWAVNETKARSGLYNRHDMSPNMRFIGAMSLIARDWLRTQVSTFTGVIPGVRHVPGLREAAGYDRAARGILQAATPEVRRALVKGTSQQARRVMLNYMISAIAATTLANMVTSKLTTGQIRTPWQNYQDDPLHTFDIVVGRDAQGNYKYMNMPLYYQVIEPLDYIFAGLSGIQHHANESPYLAFLQGATARASGKLNIIPVTTLETLSKQRLYNWLRGDRDPSIQGDKQFNYLMQSMGIKPSDPRYSAYYFLNKLDPLQHNELQQRTDNPWQVARAWVPLPDAQKVVEGVQHHDVQEITAGLGPEIGQIGGLRPKYSAKVLTPEQRAQSQANYEAAIRSKALQDSFHSLAQTSVDAAGKDHLYDIGRQIGWSPNRIDQELKRDQQRMISRVDRTTFDTSLSDKNIGGHILSEQETEIVDKQIFDSQNTADNIIKGNENYAGLTDREQFNYMSQAEDLAKTITQHNYAVEHGWVDGAQIDVASTVRNNFENNVEAMGKIQSADAFSVASKDDQNRMLQTTKDIVTEASREQAGLSSGDAFPVLNSKEITDKVIQMNPDQITDFATRTALSEQQMRIWIQNQPEYQDLVAASDKSKMLNSYAGYAKEYTMQSLAGVVPGSFEQYGLTSKGNLAATKDASGNYKEFVFAHPFTPDEALQLAQTRFNAENFMMAWGRQHLAEVENLDYNKLAPADQILLDNKYKQIGRQEAEMYLAEQWNNLDVKDNRSLEQRLVDKYKNGVAAVNGYVNHMSPYTSKAQHGISLAARYIRTYRSSSSYSSYSSTNKESQILSAISASNREFANFLAAGRSFLHTSRGNSAAQFLGKSHLLPEIEAEIKSSPTSEHFNVGHTLDQIIAEIKHPG